MTPSLRRSGRTHYHFTLRCADSRLGACSSRLKPGWGLEPSSPNPALNPGPSAKPPSDRRMFRAREVALNLGGVPRMNTFSNLYLALLGLFPWEYVPTIPCEIILIGKWFHVNFWEMSNWSRGMLVPLAIINHYRPTRTPRNNVNLDELYPQGF